MHVPMAKETKLPTTRTALALPTGRTCGVSKENSAETNPPWLFKLRRGHLAIHICNKLQGILAKANRDSEQVGVLSQQTKRPGRAKGQIPGPLVLPG